MTGNNDHEILARVQTKEKTNRSIHWTHQYALKDKVSVPTLDTAQPQKNVKDLQLVDLLREKVVQDNLIWQWAVIISRILTRYIPAMKDFKKSVMYHIPNTYSKEMSTKSDAVSFYFKDKLTTLVTSNLSHLVMIWQQIFNEKNYSKCALVYYICFSF